jgi:subtilisin family serine protease
VGASKLIDQELAAHGVAQVIVFLTPALRRSVPRRARAGAGAQLAPRQLAPLARHFVPYPFDPAAELARTAPVARAPGVRYYAQLGILLGSATRAGISRLRASAGVARVAGAPSISLIRPRQKRPARLSTTFTWGLRALQADRLWRDGWTGRGVLIGHLDTGADGAHPALRGAIESFAELDDLGRVVAPGPAPYDTEDHGTHTAATLVGRPVGGRHVGVAPDARLASAIVIEGGNVVARVLGGMDWAVGRGVRVLSLSLGFRGWWDDFRALTGLLRERDVLPVFAVGNEGPGTSRSPGNYAEALSVGAHDRERRVAPFSSSQRFVRARDPIVPDLVAPGVEVVSAKPGGGYQAMDGSSMATPHVAGLAALLMQARPQRSVDEIEAALFASCVLPDGASPERAHRGVPNAVRALAALT